MAQLKTVSRTLVFVKEILKEGESHYSNNFFNKCHPLHRVLQDKLFYKSPRKQKNKVLNKQVTEGYTN